MRARTVTREPSPLGSVIDPGWLFLLGGLALLSAAMIIPSRDQLEEARWQRDRTLATEAHATERLQRYRSYLGSLDRGEPEVIRALAATQLNLIAADRRLLDASATPGDASVFGPLEPPPPTNPPRAIPDSRLRRLAVEPGSRLWLLAAGLFATFVGLLPKALPAAARDDGDEWDEPDEWDEQDEEEDSDEWEEDEWDGDEEEWEED